MHLYAFHNIVLGEGFIINTWSEYMQAGVLMIGCSIICPYQLIVLVPILLELIWTWCSRFWPAVFGSIGKGGFALPFLYLYQFRESFHQMHHSYKLVMVRLQILTGTDSCQIFGCWKVGRWVKSICITIMIASAEVAYLSISIWFQTLNLLLEVCCFASRVM